MIIEGNQTPAQDGVDDSTGTSVTSLEAGSLVPDCMLMDAEGQEINLSDLYRQKPLVLVFYRGNWCPYCRRQLKRLQDVQAKIISLGASLAAVAVDPPELSRRLAADLGLSYPLMSDTGGKMIDAFGVRNNLLGRKSPIPHPAVFIIDPTGRIKFRDVRRNYKRRTSPGRLLRSILATIGPEQDSP